MRKAEARKTELVEAGIWLCARSGLDSISYEAVARRVGVTRQLVLHHFPQRDAFLAAMFERVRGEVQESAVRAMEFLHTPEERVSAYYRSGLEFVWAKEDFARTWIQFIATCSTRLEFRKIHSEFLAKGTERLQGLLEAGERLGQFPKASALERKRLAQMIQVHLAGNCVFLTSQVHPKDFDRAAFIEHAVQELRRRLVGRV